jgi:hypothetical protein
MAFPPTDFAALEARVAASIEETNTRTITQRRMDKAAMLAHMYGAGPKAFADAARHTIKREHPLQYMAQFQFIERVSMWGGVPLYKTATKVTSEIICKKNKIPHTDVYFDMMIVPVEGLPDVVGLVWTRATDLEQMGQAVATAIMLGHDVLVLRAFEP